MAKTPKPKKTKANRAKVKDLPPPKKKLSEDEMKKVKGGMVLLGDRVQAIGRLQDGSNGLPNPF